MPDPIETQILNRSACPPSKILIVDDDTQILTMLNDILKPRGFEVSVSHSSGDALEKLIDFHYNLLLLDAHLPGISGFELLKYCKKHHPMMEIIMITGSPELDAAISTVKDGAFDYITKPFSIEKLLRRINDAIEHQKKRLADSLAGTDPGKSNTIELLANYKLIKTLGAGTMGIVFHVAKNNREYAIKILRKESEDAAHGLRIKRFLREAKILAEIDHPNIVKIFEFGFHRNSNIPYILMEYINGQALNSCIKDNQLNDDQKWYIIAQIAFALATVHQHGVLHRDIKPANILLTHDLNAKLTDFGIARISDSSLTMTHEVLGSPAYMPPEAFNPQETIDQRADIFSLGVLSYELITGQKPFHGDTVAEMMGAIQYSKPIDPCKLDPSISSRCQEILARMLAKKPADRYSDASEIVEAINKLREPGPEETTTRKLFRSMIGSPKVWA